MVISPSPENERWLLPEGINELLPQQAEALERLRRELLDLFHSWGYELVMPPLIEYIESLSLGSSNDLDLQTFKLIDQLTGRLMGVRADMTPQVARIDAHLLKREAPTRLCYIGPVLQTRPSGFERSRELVQVGAELYGHTGIESDIEILRLMTAMLQQAGIEQLHIDLGHVGIFRGLAAEAGLDCEQERALFNILQRKAKAEIEAQLKTWSIAAPEAQRLLALVDLNGGAEVLDESRKVLCGAGQGVIDALENLCQIAAAAEREFAELPLYFDLAELRGYHYQSGVVFAAFVPGHGQEIARGGRYDGIGEVFGRHRPATGFSADLKTLMALSVTKAKAVQGIFAPLASDEALAALVMALRQQGERVVAALPGQQEGAAAMGCDRQLVMCDGKWQVEPISGQ